MASRTSGSDPAVIGLLVILLIALVGGFVWMITSQEPTVVEEEGRVTIWAWLGGLFS